MPERKTYCRIPKINIVDVDSDVKSLYDRDRAISVRDFVESTDGGDLQGLAIVRMSPEIQNSYVGEMDVPIATAQILGRLDGIDKIGVVFDDIYDISLDLLMPQGASIVYDGFRDALQQAGKTYPYVPLVEHESFQPAPDDRTATGLLKLWYCGKISDEEYRNTGLCRVSAQAVGFFRSLPRLLGVVEQGDEDEVFRKLYYNFDVPHALRHALPQYERDVVREAVEKVYKARAYGNYNKVKYVMNEQSLSESEIYQDLKRLSDKVAEIADIWSSLVEAAVEADGVDAFKEEVRESYKHKKGQMPFLLWRKADKLAVEALEEACGIDYAMENYAAGLPVEAVLGR